ncbi:Glutamate carboxypeptidase 2 [Acipenser ruthenus]|uniref:Glutamate carboxypeptidase 2 n=1 Tax=Acipenser ruthenus TaxID=7906 RepID=A0A444V129_ACIRT|nr:Glutamate carboxypeptidase 2 [Acipenser ruthenus]
MPKESNTGVKMADWTEVKSSGGGTGTKTDRKPISNNKAHITLLQYDGMANQQAFVVQFELVTWLEEWPEAEKALQLVASLIGEALPRLCMITSEHCRDWGTEGMVVMLPPVMGVKLQDELCYRRVEEQSGLCLHFHSTLQYFFHMKCVFPLEVLRLNDQLMDLERAFIDPLGISGRPWYRHVIFSPSLHDAYGSSSFLGLMDALFDIEKDQARRWEQVKKEISVITFIIHSAASTMKGVNDIGGL